MVMFKKIIFWCEFPEQVKDWKATDKLLKKIKIPVEVYTGVQSVNEYRKWKKKTRIPMYPWPLLSRKEGYWFSGFSSKKSIDKLKQYKGIKMKIDLEPPIPPWSYTTPKIVMYAIKKIFQKGKNNDYLKKVVYDVAGKGSGVVTKNVNMLINEFPLTRWYLKNQGTFIELKHGMSKNYMCYSTFAGSFFRPIVRLYLKVFTKFAVKKNPNVMFSIGLIGTGALKKEGTYRKVKEFKEDLRMIEKSGCNEVAVYSLESVLKRSNPEEWINAINEFV